MPFPSLSAPTFHVSLDLGVVPAQLKRFEHDFKIYILLGQKYIFFNPGLPFEDYDNLGLWFISKRFDSLE